MESPEVVAAAVVLLCGWMAHVDIPKVFLPPRFRLAESGPQGLRESAHLLAGAAKPVSVTAEVVRDEAELNVRMSPKAAGRTRCGPALPDQSMRLDAVVLVYGGNVRLRVPAGAFRLIAEEYDVDWVWGSAGWPASDPPSVVQHFAPADREGVAWFLQLGARRGEHLSSPVWVASDPPVV